MTQTTSESSQGLGLCGWLILLTLCGATFMTGLDYSIITVALPECQAGAANENPSRSPIKSPGEISRRDPRANLQARSPTSPPAETE
jgi:hypothetical protein